MEIEISICTYNDGKFDVMFQDKTGRQVSFSGDQKLSDDQFDFANEIAPGCVWTKYKCIEN